MRTILADRREPKCTAGLLVSLLLSWSCSGELLIAVEPSEVHFGEVDFKDWPTDMPTEGYGATAVTVTNDGEKTLSLTMVTADHDRLCTLGISDAMLPYRYPDLEPGKSLLVQLGVCAYLAEEGDRDTLISSEIVLRSDKPSGEVTIPWSFTPIVDQGTDTGF